MSGLQEWLEALSLHPVNAFNVSALMIVFFVAMVIFAYYPKGTPTFFGVLPRGTAGHRIAMMIFALVCLFQMGAQYMALDAITADLSDEMALDQYAGSTVAAKWFGLWIIPVLLHGWVKEATRPD